MKSLDINNNSSKNKRQVFFGLLFPLFLSPFIVSCQSSMNAQRSASLSLSQEKTFLANAANQNSEQNLPVEEIRQGAAEEGEKPASNSVAPVQSVKAQKSNKNSKKSIVYAPSTQTRPEDDLNLNINDSSALLPTDEIEDSSTESLISNNLDEALSAESPTDPVSGMASTSFSDGADDSLLLCEDNVYYDSWKNQFDNNWLEENGNQYKSAASRNKALTQARMSEFIKTVYPSVEKTGFDFPVVINNQVLQWVNYFRNSGKKSFAAWLTRGRTVIPEMKKTLEKYGLPKDLVYLSMIESGFNSKALSYVGAVGPWQFMPATARENGLKINDYIDERRDYKKSTKAAANYLSDLYAQFGSWHLAAASYNGGPGLVRRTLKNYGTDSSFFQLTSMGVVNRETADYVPKLIAAMIISKNPEKFGFDLSETSSSATSKTIVLTRSISLADLAKNLKIDKSVLDALNPELRLGITPPPHATSTGEFELQVPASKYENALMALNNIPDASNKYLLAARIKRRETVASFVARYRLNTSSVLNANSHLKMNSHLQKGQVVYIPVSLGTGQYDRLSSGKYSGKKMAKKSSAKHSLVASQSSHKNKKMIATKSSSNKAKAYVKSKKQTKSSTAFHKKSSNKKVAVSGTRKKSTTLR